MEEQTKICRQCGIEKDLTEFYTQNVKRKSGIKIIYGSYCKECSKKNAEEWRRKPENREKWLQVNKNKNKQPKYKQMMKEASKKQKENGYYRKYQQENKEKINEYGKLRRMNKEHDITEQEWLDCLEFFNDSCAYCGITEEQAILKYGQQLHKEHLDHNGVNDITNCVPACRSCNSKKWEFEFDEWYNLDNPIYSKRRYNKIIKWLMSFAEEKVN